MLKPLTGLKDYFTSTYKRFYVNVNARDFFKICIYKYLIYHLFPLDKNNYFNLLVLQNKIF